MLLSPEVIKGILDNFKQQEQKLTEKEKDEITALELVLEMHMRGISFLSADLYKSDPKRFLMEDGKLRVPFISLGGLGEAAAEAIVRERVTPFLSIEDLKNRAKLSSAVIELLRTHGCLNGMTETSQMTLFNFL
jgi:DNA polymerase-3 subunit alpha (Gram-positive type)